MIIIEYVDEDGGLEITNAEGLVVATISGCTPEFLRALKLLEELSKEMPLI
jgi:hypothetical protein